MPEYPSSTSRTGKLMNSKEASSLILHPNLPDGDDFYDELLRAHQDLTDAESEDFNARLILVLCNHIGDRNIIRQALQAARSSS